MINQKLVQEIFMSPLCIEKNYAQALAMSAWYTFSGNKQATVTNYVKSYTINAATGVQQSQESTPGSVGIVVINGPILSESDPWYGIKGTLEAAQEFLQFEADPNIIGTVFYLESGGGSVYAIKPLVDVLNSLSKPVVTFSKQILASAAYRLSANTDYIMMYHPQGIVGSLGTMYSSSDIQPMLEKWGMKFFEYYATESTLKNKTFNDAKAGDPTALINNVLDPMNELFLGDIKALRGDKIDSKEKSIYQGETFLAAPNGIDLGLIDATGTLQDAVAMVVTLANGDAQSSINANFKSQNNTMALFNKFPKLGAIAKASAGTITADQVKAVNEELVAEGVKGVTLCLDSELETIDAEHTNSSQSTTENGAVLATINAALGAGNEKQTLTEAFAAYALNAKTALDSKTTELQTITTDRDSWKAKAVEYGVKPAAETTASKKEGQEVVESVAAPDPYFSVADAQLAEARAKAGYQTKKAPAKK